MRRSSGLICTSTSSASGKTATVAALVCGLIEEKRIRTTLPKARQARQLAEKMVTLARTGTLAARRRAVAVLHRRSRVAKLFAEIAPQFEGRHGGYSRIVKLGQRRGDGSEVALLEWVGVAVPDKRKKKKDKKEEGKAGG